MNIVFMGTPDFAVEALSKIYSSGHNVLAVVSQPDRPSGRNMKLTKTPVKEFAESKNIKVFQTEKIRKDRELIDTLKSLKPDVIVVVAFGQILPEEVLNIPKYGSINVHGSLLPKYRGAAPIQWAVINGDEFTGVTTMYMDVGMDTGDMIETEKVDISDDETYGSLYEKMKVAGGKLIVSTLEKIADGICPRTKQPEDGVSIAPMIEKTLGNIEWNKSSKDIRNLIRGLNPMPGAYTTINNEKIKIWNSKIRDEYANIEKEAGTVLFANNKDGLIIKTQDSAIEVIELQMSGSKKMFAKDYFNGHTKINENDLCKM